MPTLAKRILENVEEDITQEELYNRIKEYSKEFINLLEQYVSEEDIYDQKKIMGMLFEKLEYICNELDKEGFTYYMQPSAVSDKIFKKIAQNYIEFYKGYTEGFTNDQLEIFNTNTKDLLNFVEKRK